MVRPETFGYSATASLDVPALDLQKPSRQGAVFLYASSGSFESQGRSSVQRMQSAEFATILLWLKRFKIVNDLYVYTAASRRIDIESL